MQNAFRPSFRRTSVFLLNNYRCFSHELRRLSTGFTAFFLFSRVRLIQYPIRSLLQMFLSCCRMRFNALGPRVWELKGRCFRVSTITISRRYEIYTTNTVTQSHNLYVFFSRKNSSIIDSFTEQSEHIQVIFVIIIDDTQLPTYISPYRKILP